MKRAAPVKSMRHVTHVDGCSSSLPSEAKPVTAAMMSHKTRSPPVLPISQWLACGGALGLPAAYSLLGEVDGLVYMETMQ